VAGDTTTRRRAGRLASGGAIRAAATRLFLARGYQGTSMDDVAAAAGVSKQTIYTHFESKEKLFADLVLGNAQRVDEFVGTLEPSLTSGDVAAALRQLARRYLHLVMRPEVLQLRRLVLGEAARFPELAQTYYESVPGRVIAELARIFTRLSAEGRLSAPEPAVAAQQFAWLTLGPSLDRGMFYPIDEMGQNGELDRAADAAVTTFLAAYG
jgi:TetR/AcrR family transcriptional repressor of mexJK operon